MAYIDPITGLEEDDEAAAKKKAAVQKALADIVENEVTAKALAEELDAKRIQEWGVETAKNEAAGIPEVNLDIATIRAPSTLPATANLVSLNSGVSVADYVKQFGESVYDSNKDYNAEMASSQGFAEQTGKALLAGLAKGANTLVEDFSYLGDLTNYWALIANNIDAIEDVDAWEQNSIAKWAEGNKKSIDEGWGKIYRENPDETFDLGDTGWWADSFKTMLDSAVGYGVPGLAVGKLTTMGVRAARLAAAMSSIEEVSAAARGISKAQVAENFISAGISGLISNYAEGKIMGVEIYDDVMNSAMEAGKSPAEAKAIATSAASDFLFQNRIWMATNAISTYGMFKGEGLTRGAELPKLKTTGLKATAKANMAEFGNKMIAVKASNPLFQGFIEGGEELGQSGQQTAETQLAYDKLGTLDPEIKEVLKGKTGHERYLALFNHQIWTAQGQYEALMGFGGGGIQHGVMHGISAVGNRLTGNGRAKREAALEENKKIVDNASTTVTKFLKKFAGNSVVENEANKVGDYQAVDVMDRLNWLQNVSDNLERGTTNHLEDFLTSIKDGTIDPAILATMGGSVAQEKAADLISELKTLEDQFLKDGGYSNSRKIFAKRMQAEITKASEEYHNKGAAAAIQGTPLDPGAEEALALLSKHHSYTAPDGTKHDIVYDINDIRKNNGNPQKEYDEFVKSAFTNENFVKYTLHSEYAEASRDAYIKYQADIAFEKTRAGEIAHKAEQEKLFKQQQVAAEIKKNTERDNSGSEIVAGDFVVISDTAKNEKFGTFVSKTTLPDGSSTITVKYDEEEVTYPADKFKMDKLVQKEPDTVTAKKAAVVTAAVADPVLDAELNEIAKILSNNNFNTKELEADQKQVYAENSLVIVAKAQALNQAKTNTAAAAPIIAAIVTKTAAEIEALIAPLQAAIDIIQKKRILPTTKGIDSLIKKGSNPTTKLTKAEKGKLKKFEKNLEAQKKEVEVLQKQIEEIKAANDGVVTAAVAASTTTTASSVLTAPIVASTNVAKTAVKASNKANSPTLEDKNPEKTVAIVPIEVIEGHSLQTAWKSLNIGDPADSALFENRERVTNILEDPNQSVIGTQVEMVIDDTFLSAVIKDKLAKGTLTPAEVNALPIALIWLDKDGKRTENRLWLHNEDFPALKSKDVEIAALRATRKYIYENHTQGIAVVSTINKEGYGKLNTVAESAPIQEVFGENIQLMYRGDLGMFYSGTHMVKGKRVKKKLKEYNHVVNENKPQGGVFIQGIKAANGQLVPIKVETTKIRAEAAELIYEIYRALIMEQRDFKDNITSSDSLMAFIKSDPDAAAVVAIAPKWSFSELLSFLVYNGSATAGSGEKALTLIRKADFKTNPGAKVQFGKNNKFISNYKDKSDKYHIENPAARAAFMAHLTGHMYYNLLDKYFSNPAAISFWSTSNILTTKARPTADGRFFVNPIINVAPSIAPATDAGTTTAATVTPTTTTLTTPTTTAFSTGKATQSGEDITFLSASPGYVPIIVRSKDTTTWQNAYGKPEVIPGHEQFTFFATRLEQKGPWIIVEGTTGAQFGVEDKVKNKAIEALKKKLESKDTVNAIAELINILSEGTPVQAVAPTVTTSAATLAVDPLAAALVNIDPNDPGLNFVLSPSVALDNRTPYAVSRDSITQVLGADEKGVSGESALASISEQTTDPLIKSSLALLFGNVEVNNTNILTVSLEEFQERTGYSAEEAMTTPAVYDPNSNTILFNRTHIPFLSLEEIHALVIHELMHAATVVPFVLLQNGLSEHLSEAEREFVTSITAIWSRVKNKYRVGSNKLYGFKDAMEFVAEFRTNAAFREELSLSNKNIFNRLWDAIRKFFGYSPMQTTIIKKTERIIAKYLQQSKTVSFKDKVRIIKQNMPLANAKKFTNNLDNDIISAYTPSQIQEMTDAMIYIMINSAKVDGIKDFAKLSAKHKDFLSAKTGRFEGPITRALRFKVYSFNKAGDSTTARKIAEITENNDLFNRFYEEMQLKLEAYYGVIFKNDEEEEDDRTENSGLGIKPAFETNWRDNASTNTKLMVAFAPNLDENGKHNVGEHFGLLVFANFKSTWDTLQSALTDLPHLETTTDSLDPMIQKIKEIAAYKPNFRYFVDILSDPKTPQEKKSQFHNAFSMNEVLYTTGLFHINEQGTLVYKVGQSEHMGNISTEKSLLIGWQDNMLAKISSTDYKNQTTLNVVAAGALIDQFRKVKKAFLPETLKEEISDEVYNKFIKDLVTVLNNSGILIDANVLNFTTQSLFGGDKKTALETMIMEWFSRIYTDSGKTSNSLSSLIAKGVPLDSEFGLLKTALTEENRTMMMLANMAKVFNTEITENMVPAAGKNNVWKYSKNSYVNRYLAELKADKSLVARVKAMPYYQHSKLLDFIEAGGELDILQWLNFQEEFSDDLGSEYTKIAKTDDFVDRVNRVLKGYLPYLNTADKSRHLNIKGPEKILSGIKYNSTAGSWDFESEEAVNALKLIADLVVDEIAVSNLAYQQIKGEIFPGNVSSLEYHKHVLYFHYLLDENNNRVYMKNGEPVGNWAKINSMASLSYKFKDALELDIYSNTGEAYLPTNELRDSIAEKVKRALSVHLDSHVQFAVESELFSSIAADSLVDYSGETSLDILTQAHADVVFNSLYWNMEMTKLFIGDTRFYKNMGDIKKRIPAGIASGADLRIYQDTEGNWEVNPNYEQQTLTNFVKPSDFFTEENIPLIAKTIIQAGETEASALKRAKNLIGDPIKKTGYQGIDVTNAQGWITMERAIEIYKGLGKWTKEHIANIDAIMDGSADSKLLDLFFQPIKGVHFELREVGGMLVPSYTKYSSAVLHPAFTAGTDLDNLRVAMEARQKVSGMTMEAIVLEGIKVGAADIANWIGENNKILPSEELIFSPTVLRNKHWKQQQDLPTKGMKDALVGSQIKKNIIANLDLNHTYGDMTGREILQALTALDISLSNEGAIYITEKLGYDRARGEFYDIDKMYEFLYKELKDSPRMLREGIKNGLPFDAFPQFIEQIESTLTSAVGKKTVKLKQLGGSYVQMASAGFVRGSSIMPDNIKNKILWIKGKPKTPSIEDTPEGTVIKSGQVLLPHKVLVKLREVFPNLSDSSLLAKISPEILEGIGYRIPNQANSSNDAIEIVGILPEFVGDTVVVYEEITTKTGSDFDIDKMFILLPEYTVNKKNGATIVKYLSKTGTYRVVTGKDPDGKNITIERSHELDRYFQKWQEYKNRPRVKDILSEINDQNANAVKELEALVRRYKGEEWYSKALKELRDTEEESITVEAELESATILELIDLLSKEEDSDTTEAIEELWKVMREKKAAATALSKELSAANKDAISAVIDNALSIFKREKKLAGNQLKALRIAIESEIWSKAVEDGLIPSLEEFSRLSLEDQNTKKALSNRRIDLYRKILLDPSKFEEVMTPLDAEDVKNNIISVTPKVDESADLGFYTLLTQLSDKHNFIGGKFGVGLTANQLVDAAIGQYADLYMSQLTTSDIPAHYNKDGYMDLTQMYDTKGRLISQIISAYLNAYVDIAKDPYIVKGNHNLLTANVVFMLLRAGVPYEWANAFVAQPIIRRYVELSSKTDGRTGPEYLNVTKELKSEFPTKPPTVIFATEYFNGLTEESLFKATQGDVDGANQQQVLGAFKYLRDRAKELSDSILTSKADTAVPKSLLEAYIMANRISEVYSNGEIGNYTKKFDNTSLGIFTENSMVLVNQMFQGLFVYNDKNFRNKIDTVAMMTTGKKALDLEQAELVRRELYTGFLSEAFHLPEADRRALFYGKNNIAQQNVKIRNSKRHLDNSIVKALRQKIRQKSPSLVAYKNLKGTSNMSVDQLHRDWLNLYTSDNKDDVKYAKDLVYAAFYQSGARMRGSSFYHLIPPVILKDMGIIDKIIESAAELANNPNMLDEVMEQVFKHNKMNEKLIPRIKFNRRLQNMVELNSLTPFTEGFMVPNRMGKYVIGSDIDGNLVFSRYITRESVVRAPGGDAESIFTLFEYVGNTAMPLRNAEGDVELDENGKPQVVYGGAYRAASELGYDLKGEVMVEYGITPEIVDDNVLEKQSIIPKNNINFDTVGHKSIQDRIDFGNKGGTVADWAIVMPSRIMTRGEINTLITDSGADKTPSDSLVEDLIRKCK